MTRLRAVLTSLIAALALMGLTVPASAAWHCLGGDTFACGGQAGNCAPNRAAPCAGTVCGSFCANAVVAVPADVAVPASTIPALIAPISAVLHSVAHGLDPPPPRRG